MTNTHAHNPITLIPARMESNRLPNKPMADIHGKPMICHVIDRAREVGLGRVVVACSENIVKEAVESYGGEAVLTDPELPSGSDRILQALHKIDPDGEHDIIINFQGDLPTIDPETVKAAYALMENDDVDIGTLVTRIQEPSEITNPSVVKAIADINPEDTQGRALYFTRATAPSGDGPLYHHIGLYTYKRAALEKFVQSPPSVLEQRERLEQLRALAMGMRIDVAVVNTRPLGVDTPADLETARELLS